jgi:hypothetical protein
MWHSAETTSVIEYLLKYESVSERVLDHESGGLKDIASQKNRGSKFRDAVPSRKKKVRKFDSSLFSLPTVVYCALR